MNLVSKFIRPSIEEQKRLKVKELLEKAIPHGDCLISHLAPNGTGYIPVSIGGRTGKKYRASRLICEVIHGGISEEERALHTCDVPACISPAHIYVGTAKQNTQDMMNRGRNSYTIHPKIFRMSQVEEMQQMKDAGSCNTWIGLHFNISHETVRVYLNKDHPKHEKAIARLIK